MPEVADERLLSERARALARDGCLLLEDALDGALVDELRAAFDERHRAPASDAPPAGMLRVGDRRFMVTVRLRPPFTDPRLVGNPLLLGTLTELLGADRILLSFGAVVSQPGAEDQHVHSDTGGLFGDPVREGELPPYAITAIVPLVDMDEVTGTTRVWPGSHRIAKADLERLRPHDPVVRTGSVLLMDYRLHHGGLANRSDGPRPILSLVFARPWFRDAVNFTVQPPLLYGPLERRRMPPELRDLLPPPTGATLDGGVAAKTARRIAARAPARLARVVQRYVASPK